ncbi:hypothetical protein VTO73DRAFT_11446 [Trametes versicolor]
MSTGLGDLLSDFQAKQNRPGLGQGALPTRPAISRGQTPVSGLTNDDNNDNFSPFASSLSAGLSESAMDLDGDEEASSTRLSSLMGEHEADGGLSGSGHLRSQYRNHVEDKVRKYGLSTAQHDELLEFCELSPVLMLIDLKIHKMRIENDILKRFLRLFVRHPDFVIRLRHTVAAALLAPNLPAYVEGLTTQLTRYLEDHAERLLGVPNAQKSDPADWALIKSSIAVELSNQRSAMKLKIDTSIKNSQDIYELTHSLLRHNNMRPKKEHWGRFAFLRQCTVKYDSIPAKKRGDFWKHIDQCLIDARKNAQDQYPRPEDTSARKKHETLIITHFLEIDISGFPLKSGGHIRVVYENEALTELQYTTEQVVGAFLADDIVVPPAGVRERSPIEHSASDGRE